jgi:tRNA-splicing endonuclease subunit Sen34
MNDDPSQVHKEITTSTNIIKMETPVPISVPYSIPNRRTKDRNNYITGIGYTINAYSPRKSSPLAVYHSDTDDEIEDKNLKILEESQQSIKKSFSISNNNIICVNDNEKFNNESRTTSEGTNISTIDDDNEEFNKKFKINKDELIPLFIHGDHVLVFNNKNMKDLTIKYGITGQLSGTLPLAPQQNLLLGFPWRLSIYEVLWCLNQGIAILVDSENLIKNGYLNKLIGDENLQNILTQDLNNRLDKWRDEKQKEIEEQLKKLNIIKKDRRVMKPLDNIMIASSASMPDLQQVLNDNEKKEQEIREKKKKEREMHEKSKRNKIVFMETSSDDSNINEIWLNLITEENHEKSIQIKLLKRLLENQVENEEKILMNFMMYNYMKTKLGQYLLPGMRFGGTFVAYPGDPLRYHAHQIVETKEYYNEDIGLFRMCNRGRLATGVRKVWVVGGTREEKFLINTNIDIETDIDENEDDIIEGLDIPTKSNLIDHILSGSNSIGSGMICFSVEWAGF